MHRRGAYALLVSALEFHATPSIQQRTIFTFQDAPRLMAMDVDESTGVLQGESRVGEVSRADEIALRILRVPDALPRPSSTNAAERLFSFAIFVSALRCTLSYVIMPFVLPALGLGAMASVGPWVGLPIGLAAIFFDVKGIRRFWVARHRWRWHMTFLYLAVIGLVLYLIAGDIVRLL